MQHAPYSFELGGVEVFFGSGELGRLPELAGGLGLRRVLLVTDPGLLATGHPQRAAAGLEAAGIAVALFADTGENPDTLQVEKGAAAAKEHAADGLVALGGGSALDTARGLNFLVSGGGRMEDYWGDGHIDRPMLPSIGIPTTAGTGSDAQRFALISQAESHVKMACGDRKARFRQVILDPELLATAPREVAALAGYDAISHAVESFVSRKSTPFSRLLAREAWQRLEGSFAAHLHFPEVPGPAAEMLLGAHLAGAAIEASMLGAAHSCANPLTAKYGTRHGAAVALFLPHVVRLNARVAADRYGELARVAGLADAEALASRLEVLRQEAGLPSTLRELGVAEEELPELAAAAARQWTAQFNPFPVAEAELLGLYRLAFSEVA